jgi:hypothetical protein
MTFGSALLAHQLTPPPVDGWSWVNQGTATVQTGSDGSIVLAAPAQAATSLFMRTRPTYSQPASVTARFTTTPFNANGGVGLGYRESATGKLLVHYIKPAGAITNEYWASPTSYTSGSIIATWANFAGNASFRLTDNGTTLVIEASMSGHVGSFIEMASFTRTTNFTTAPDQFVFVGRDANSPVSGVLNSWVEG